MMSSTGQQQSNQTLRRRNSDNGILATNYKTINGFGFYSCDTCPFLCLNVELFLEHKEKEYHFSQSSLTSLLKFKCIACDNIFYSIPQIRYHLLEDHDCSSIEIDRLIKIVIEANKKDSYLPEEIGQIQNASLADFNNINNDAISTSENNQNLIDPQITEEIGQIQNASLADYNNINDAISTSENNQNLIDPQITGEIGQIQNASLADFNNINNDAISTSENNQNLIDPQITEENIIVANTSNETPENIENYQVQEFNEIQENKTNYNQKVIKKDIKCPIGLCKIKFGKEKNLVYHLQCHIKGGFKCVELDCQYVIKSWLTMMLHLWKKHKVDIEMFSCNKCDFKTNKLYILTAIHEYIHDKKKPFICSECGKGFHTKKQLKIHNVIHENTKQSANSVLSCLHCYGDFTTKILFDEHITSKQTEEISRSCVGCKNGLLGQHICSKPFKCIECCYSTANHTCLKRHKMRHTGEKNYVCMLCHYSCIQAASYKQHLKSKHPGMESGIIYCCDKCDFNTICKNTYLIHIAKHNGEPVQ